MTTDAVSNASNKIAASNSNRIPVQTLGQDDFIKILVAQLTTQDPLNPQKDTEFVAQMAQFSQLESSKGMKDGLDGLRAQQDLFNANSLIGRRIQFANGQNGMVSAVQVEEGIPLLAVGDKTFSLGDVARVESSTK